VDSSMIAFDKIQNIEIDVMKIFNRHVVQRSH
jgi:hypothetical protein